MDRTSLHIYLNDHLGLLRAEMEAAKRIAAENAGTELARFLAEYSADCAESMSLIESLLVADGGGISHLKQVAAWLAEKAGRLKPNGAIIGYTRLARVLEIEFLISAAEARRSFGESMNVINLQHPDLSDVDWATWCEKIQKQILQLKAHHRSAAFQAFGNPSDLPT